LTWNLGTIYLICAIAGGTILVLRLIFMLVGFDQGDGADIPMELNGAVGIDDTGGGMTLLSMQSIAGFFTMFGLVGMGLLQIETTALWSLFGALVAGGFTAWATAMIFLQMRRLQSEGNFVISNAIGQIGTVYLTIPETGTGVVSIAVNGTLRSLDAISEKGQRIPTGSMVRVVATTAGKILIVVEHITDQS